MKAGVVVFPGSNCDRDSMVALEQLINGSWGKGQVEGAIHPLWHGDTQLPELDLIIIPGGFSYGDYLRSGAMAAHSPIMQEVKRHAEIGKYVLGICNGFQVLTETGLLAGALMRNRDLSFICKDVHLRVENNKTPFTKNYTEGQVISLPVAHHDGCFFADEETLANLKENNQIIFRYANADGEADDAANPNGSSHNIAAISNKQGNVIGMMPHPERAIEQLTGGTNGRALLESVLSKIAA